LEDKQNGKKKRNQVRRKMKVTQELEVEQKPLI
jgi:hypothetical protein